MGALLRPVGTFADAHGTAVHVICAAVVLASFAFVATARVVDRLRRPSEPRARRRFRSF